MALSEQEEFELLSLERERAMRPQAAPPSLVDRTRQLLDDAAASSPYGRFASAGKKALEGLDTVAQYAGGVATDQAAKVLPAEVAGGIGTAVSVGVPALIGGGVARKAAPEVAKAGENMMIRALKPSMDDLRSGDAAKAAKTMLEEGVNVTAGGVEKMQTKITGLNDELQAALNSSPATIDKAAVASRLQEVITNIEGSTLRPQDRVKAVEKIYNQVLGNTAQPNQIPVAIANKIKSGIYKELGDLKYQRSKTGSPVSDAEKSDMALARGIREDISAAVPESAPLNEKMGKLINAMNIAEDEVLRASKRDPGGLALLTHGVTRLALMLAARDPATKSMLARALHSSAETATTGAGAAAGGTAGAVRAK